MASRAGQANEAGSVHRRGVAVFLVAHGLASRPVAAADPRPENPAPVALAFETAHATDDLLCTLSDGSRLFISAKRACGNNAQLVDTVEQWLRQVDQLQPGDRLVLATAAPAGIVRHLGGALRRRRNAPDSVFAAPEKQALAALRARMADAPADKQNRVLNAAVVLEVDADEAGRPHYELASALLEGTVVPAGWGGAALSHLQTLMHTEAGRAYTGDVESWVDHLTKLRVPVFADRSGPAAAAIQARRIAVEHYCRSLSSVAGQVDLSLLAEDLEPLIVDDLADHLLTTVPTSSQDGDAKETPLLALARRVPRLLVEGLPGSGKSAAVTQLAARWATDPAAPLPIVVRLRELAQACRASSDVSLALLCELAAAHAPIRERVDLVDAMQISIARGEAVLLLDGLDECLDQRALVAQGLNPIVAALPPETGVLLTTRPSGLTAAGRLSLEVAQLSTPSNLDAVLDQLLRYIAHVRVAAETRDTWIGERSKRVRNIREAHKDLGSVPLLAVLITLVLADDRDATLPSTTAGVLRTAVTQTIDRWERRRPRLPDGFSVRPTDNQLLIGFAAIGHLLSHRTTPSTADVQSAISSAIGARWHLAPEPAAEVARAIQWFWDDQVGVFVAEATGRVVARSRVFTEIGAAMWCPSMSESELHAWVSAAVRDRDRHTALLLAVELDARVITELLTQGDDRAERCRLAAKALRNGATATAAHTSELLSQLAENAEQAAVHSSTAPSTQPDRERSARTLASAADLFDAADDRRLREDGRVWPWALEIARLPIPSSLEMRRTELLTAISLTNDQHLIASGIAALASADTAARPLTLEEQVRVLRMLSVPLPPKGTGQSLQVSRRRFVVPKSVSLIEGLGQGAARAATRLTELDDRAAELISAIAERAGHRDAFDIAAAMRRHGHNLNVHLLPPQTIAMLSQVGDEIRDGERILVETVTRLSNDEAQLTASQRWRLPDLCDFFDLLDERGVPLPEFRTAVQVDTAQTRASWIRCMALATGLDLALLAEQARIALVELADEHSDRLLALFYASRRVWDHDLAYDRVLSERREEVLGLLTAASDWIARSALRLLWNARTPGLAEEIADLLPDVSPSRRFLLAVLCCRLSEEPAARLRSLLESTDPALRRAAAAAARGDSNPEIGALRERALLDEDVTIRIAAGATTLDDPRIPPPSRWSCRWCTAINEFDTEDCHGCDQGTRPHINED